MLVTYWTNKKKVKKANNETNSSVFCSNAVISKFTSSVLPENNNEGKLCQSLPIKLKRTSHTKYAVKLNSGVFTLTFEREAETQVPKRKPSGVSGHAPLKIFNKCSAKQLQTSSAFESTFISFIKVDKRSNVISSTQLNL